MPGTNQPGGPFAPSSHPVVAGRERELRHLADGVRRLIAGTMTVDADDATVRALADRVGRLADDAETQVPDPVPPRLHLGTSSGLPHGGSPFDVVHGLYNPLAPPLEMSHEGSYAVGVTSFGVVHEGPPGRVHGAVIAAAFDMVLSSANVVAGTRGPTARLRVHYERATRLHRPVRFEGHQDEVDGRRIHTTGTLVQDDRVTCRAEGLFISLDDTQLAAMGRDGADD